MCVRGSRTCVNVDEGSNASLVCSETMTLLECSSLALLRGSPTIACCCAAGAFLQLLKQLQLGNLLVDLGELLLDDKCYFLHLGGPVVKQRLCARFYKGCGSACTYTSSALSSLLATPWISLLMPLARVVNSA